jgi:hypothetical protein
MAASPTRTRTTAPKGKPQITSAASWQNGTEAEGVVTELPSGKFVMLVRKLDLPLMLRSGRIPNPLSQVIQRMISSGKKEVPTEDMADPVVFQQMMDMVDISVSAAMVEPKALVPPMLGKRPGTAFNVPETEEDFQRRVDEFQAVLDDPEANTISTDWISIEDKIFIFFFSQGGAADLAQFRRATGNAMAAISAGGAVELPSE